MLNLSRFLREHKNIILLINKIEMKLLPGIIQSEPDKVRGLLTDLSVKLVAHMLGEDKFLYPIVLSSCNEKVKPKVQEFITEVTQITNDFRLYSAKWMSPKLLSENPEEFIMDSNKILKVIKKRIENEDGTIFPFLSNAIASAIDPAQSTNVALKAHL